MVRCCVEQTRVSDLKGLTVVNQRKWAFMYERLVKEVRIFPAYPLFLGSYGIARRNVVESIGRSRKCRAEGPEFRCVRQIVSCGT